MGYHIHVDKVRVLLEQGRTAEAEALQVAMGMHTYAERLQFDSDTLVIAADLGDQRDKFLDGDRGARR